MPPHRTLRVALDSTYAGTNRTGVGIYSHQLGLQLRLRKHADNLSLRCYGPACGHPENVGGISDTVQEWPPYTHGVLPLRVLGFRPHVIHSTSHIGPLWGPGRKIVTVHDLIFMRYPEEYNRVWLFFTRSLLPRVLAQASAVIADSHATRADIAQFIGVRRKVRVIYPGIDHFVSEEPRQTRELAGIGEQYGRYILCLGPWVVRKNLSVVFEAFSYIASEQKDVRLVVTGEPPRGMSSGGPTQLARRLPAEVRSRVQLVGHVSRSRLQELLRGAAILAYPSRYEGFGLPPLEAMAAGVPVVAADAPAAAEVTGGAALLVSPDDVQGWVACISELLSSHARREDLRRAGYARTALFTWDRCASETVSLYRHVAQAGKVP